MKYEFGSRYGIVYLITNLVNGKRYVGKTVTTLSKRWWYHVRDAEKKSNKMVLHAAIRKYGKEQFKLDTLCVAKENVLCDLERVFIHHLKTKIGLHGYNMTDGGDGVSGCRPSEETRKKMSAALIGNKRSTGRKMTEDNKRKLIECIKGKKRSPEHCAALSKSLKGNVISPEHAAKISAANRTTHCKNGHLRTEENTYNRVTKEGYVMRTCRECRRKANGHKRWKRQEYTSAI